MSTERKRPFFFLQNAFDQLLTGLVALYVALLVNHALVEPNVSVWRIVILGGLTAAGLAYLRWAWAHWTISLQTAESIVAGVAGITLLSSVIHLYALSGFWGSLDLLLLGLGILTFFLSLRRLVAVHLGTLGVWIVMIGPGGASSPWLHFGIGLFVATGLKLYAECGRARIEQAQRGTVHEAEIRQQVEEALREKQALYELVMRGANDGAWDWDLQKDEIHFSPRWKEMIGMEDEQLEAVPDTWFSRVHPDDLAALKSCLSVHLQGVTPHFRAEYRIRHRDGSYRWMLCRGVAERQGEDKPCRIAGSHSDIHELKQSEQRLRQQAYHDRLTGLPNRVSLADQLKDMLGRVKKTPGLSLAALVVDLQRFKLINQSLGRSAGDSLLKQVAERLAQETEAPGSDLAQSPALKLARLDGDEFVFLLQASDAVEAAKALAKRIQKSFEEPFELMGRETFLTATIGIAPVQPEHRHGDEVLRDTEAALEQAKTEASGVAVFETALPAQIIHRINLENDLRRALGNEEYCLFYQPIVSLREDRLVGLEALLRWYHPREGLLLPRQFLWLAEETGLIVAASWWSLSEACRHLHRWRELAPENPFETVGFNLSGRQLAQPDLVEHLLRVLEESQLPPTCLHLEVSREALGPGPGLENSIEKLSELKKHGISLHLDDPGTGYLLLGQLDELPFDAVKIDRSLTAKMETSQAHQRVVESMVEVAHRLSMKVIAEGIENRKQIELLKRFGCELGQGYFYAPPLSDQEMEKLVDAGAISLRGGRILEPS